jgi:hypothetical protein
MKIKSIYTGIVFFCLPIFIVLIGCNGGEDDNKIKKNKKILTSGTWKVSDVQVNGTNQNALFSGFTITFAEATYTSTNGDPVWPATDTWSMQNETTITRGSDGVNIFIQQISESALKLELIWNKTTYGPGRSQSVAGQHVFTLTK